MFLSLELYYVSFRIFAPIYGVIVPIIHAVYDLCSERSCNEINVAHITGLKYIVSHSAICVARKLRET